MAEKHKYIQMFRGQDEPKLNPGTEIQIKDGVKGVVLAWFVPKADARSIGYLVEPKYISQATPQQ